MKGLQLAFPFTPGLVIQRGQENPVWGRDLPSCRVRLFVEGAQGFRVAEGRCDADGRFSLRCPELPPGGPYRLVVEGSSRCAVEDVLCGEVWLASGQSNMEWPVGASEGADAEIESANDSELRVLKIERQASWDPEEGAEGVWLRTNPDTVSSFGAVGYSFARELRDRLGVPIGIIDATWGGTPIAAWMSPAALRSVDPTIDDEMATLRAMLPSEKELRSEYQGRLTAWERSSFPADPPHTGISKGYHRPDFDDSAWGTLRLPTYWQNHGMSFNGVVWFRLTVEVPAAWAGRELCLSLGAIDDFDHTFFNGELVGSHPPGTPEAFQIPRRYRVPAPVVRAGENTISVRVFDHFGQGGFGGPSRAMCLYPRADPEEAIPLNGTWRVYPEHPIPLVPASVWATCPAPPLLLTPQYIPGSLHRGMLRPVLPYGVRGFLWYQGESDVERYEKYEAYQRAFVNDLRTNFGGQPLPFFFVELAGYRGGPSWPRFRDAQQKAAMQPGTALVTARDIGDPDDIHPRNKREVGRRLSLLARALVYDENVEAFGPTVERVALHGSEVEIHFSSRSCLRTRGGDAPRGFEIAGPDGAFHEANGMIVEDTVVVSSPGVNEPVQVRYAYSDTGEGDLENEAGLPALSFCKDVQPPRVSVIPPGRGS